MKRYLIFSLVVAGLFAAAGQHLRSVSAAHGQHHEKHAFTPDTIPWGPAPPVVILAHNSRSSKAIPPHPAATIRFA